MTPAALAALHAACFGDPRPWSAAEFAALLADPACVFSYDPNGFALIRVAADEAELLTLAVAPAARRQGLGRRLLAAALAEAAARAGAAVFLEVAEGNAAALALYTQAGFAEAGRRRGYFRGGDAVVMRKTLDAQ